MIYTKQNSFSCISRTLAPQNITKQIKIYEITMNTRSALSLDEEKLNIWYTNYATKFAGALDLVFVYASIQMVDLLFRRNYGRIWTALNFVILVLLCQIEPIDASVETSEYESPHSLHPLLQSRVHLEATRNMEYFILLRTIETTKKNTHVK